MIKLRTARIKSIFWACLEQQQWLLFYSRRRLTPKALDSSAVIHFHASAMFLLSLQDSAKRLGVLNIIHDLAGLWSDISCGFVLQARSIDPVTSYRLCCKPVHSNEVIWNVMLSPHKMRVSRQPRYTMAQVEAHHHLLYSHPWDSAYQSSSVTLVPAPAPDCVLADNVSWSNRMYDSQYIKGIPLSYNSMLSSMLLLPLGDNVIKLWNGDFSCASPRVTLSYHAADDEHSMNSLRSRKSVNAL